MTETDIPSPLVLEKGKARLEILPHIGGAIGSWSFDQKEIFHPRSDSSLTAQGRVAVAAYPLVPYSNRINQGRFSFGDEDYQLSPNREGSPHPIHGNGWENPWNVVHRTDTHAILVFDFRPDHTEKADSHWPFAYRAVLSYVLYEKVLEVQMVLESRDEKTQPVGLGFHPFLHCGQTSELSFSSKAVWLNGEDGLPRGKVPSAGEWSFTNPVSFYDRSLDNVFTEFGGEALLKRGEGFPDVKISADSVFTHLVVFSPEKSDFVAIEPVTMMTDAFNHPEVADRGVQVLKAGQRIGGTIRFHLGDH
ncbi:aldose 1-epimerase [Acetobacteraceae bacterium ESL0709]|nr:aldose 1-epimerase [Acetobacteraceae bacterium ESL0697]MDF7677779.1 aldose 1-epimerase [Acetobacteraceae bacterium ESL0709]